ncbi:auxin efflux carrier [Salinisphaera dokdonensis CL-ES53]|uniref:Auxin efflux carrier n=1 Tax=Salinisphaera dokdonensis CL-ES53 TaxID=1304272 RepID=A0ABV2AXK9_9GAMM
MGEHVLIRILEITVPVFGIIALAYAYGRKRPTDLRDANRLNITIFTPALIFHALTERSQGGDDFIMAAIGAAVIVLGSGLLAWAWVRVTKRDAAIYIGPAMFNNCGNLGLPLAILAFGEDALPLAVVLLVTENLLQFTVGLWLLGDSIHIKRLVTNPMLVATFAGVLGMVMDWHAPAMIEPGIRMLGEISIPLMLVALGVRLADGAPGQWAAGFWGGLLCPLTGLIVAVPWVLITQPEPPLAALLIVFGALPPAVLNYMLAEQFEIAPQQVAAIVAVGHVIALALIPLTLYWVL